VIVSKGILDIIPSQHQDQGIFQISLFSSTSATLDQLHYITFSSDIVY